MKKLLLIGMFFLFAPFSTSAQSIRGTDFWAVFMYSYDYHDAPPDSYTHTFSHYFTATGPEAAVIHVENPVHGWDTTVVKPADGAAFIIVPRSMAVYDNDRPGAESVRGHGFHITSTTPISLNATTISYHNYEEATVLPTSALGTRYVTPGVRCWRGQSMVAFAAVEDSTVLTMRLPCSTRTMQRDSVVSVTLQRGETLTLTTGYWRYSTTQINEWFTGMEVNANRPFAMFSGIDMVQLQPEGDSISCYAGNHCYEQIIPSERLGRSFLLVSPAFKRHGDWVCISSPSDSCVLRLDGDSLTTLMRDSTLLLLLPHDSVQLLTASRPVSATMYLIGGTCPSPDIGTSEVVIPALEHGTDSAFFYCVNGYDLQDNHYVNIVAEAAAVPYITLDGQPIEQQFTPFNSLYSYARIKISTAQHRIISPYGRFTAWEYSLGDYTGYSYPVAMTLRPPVEIDPGAVAITADHTEICEGDTVTLHASGTDEIRWLSVPPDNSLYGQEYSASVSVTPSVTTTYWVDGATSNTVTVVVSPKPKLCVEMKNEYIDFDDPVIDVTDCTEGVVSRQWLFSDGTQFTSPHLRRRVRQPLPDSLGVALHTCNSMDCCADTSLWLPLKVQSVWFPNIFIPGYSDAGGFGCWTSLEVEVFELTVFNRQGIMIWETEDVNARWDGGDYPQGSYVYRYYIKATTGHAESGIGTVTIIR